MDTDKNSIKEIIKHARSFILVHFTPGPNFKETGLDKDKVQAEGINFFFSKHKAGLAALAGVILDDPKLKAIVVLNVESKEEAIRILKDDPGVKSGQFVYELYDFFTSTGFILPEKPSNI